MEQTLRVQYKNAKDTQHKKCIKILAMIYGRKYECKPLIVSDNTLFS